MIVIHSSLVASPPLDEPLNYPTLGWHNLASMTNIAATTEDTLHPTENLGNPATHLYWQAAAAGAETITVSSLSGEIDYFAIAGHNFATAGMTVALEASISGGAYGSLIAAQTPPDDAPIIFRFAPASNITGLRIQLADGGSPPSGIVPRAAVIYTGKLTIFERGTQGDYTPLTHGLVHNVANGEAENGNFLGRIVTGARVESSASFKALSGPWFRNNLQPFIEASINNPFFFAWQPVDYPNEVGYAWLDKDPKPEIDENGYFNITLDMTGIAA